MLPHERDARSVRHPVYDVGRGVSVLLFFDVAVLCECDCMRPVRGDKLLDNVRRKRERTCRNFFKRTPLRPSKNYDTLTTLFDIDLQCLKNILVCHRPYLILNSPSDIKRCSAWRELNKNQKGKEKMTNKEKIIVAARHPDGERIRVIVTSVAVYGFFGNIEPGLPALCHRSKIGGLGGRQVSSVIHAGMAIDCTIHSRIITPDDVRIQLECSLDGAVPSGESCSECEAWIQAHPDASRRAHEWLLKLVADSPLHASLLGRVHDIFGVPRPVWGWARRFGDFFYRPGQTGLSPIVGLAAKRDDADYMGRMQTKIGTLSIGPRNAPGSGVQPKSPGIPADVVRMVEMEPVAKPAGEAAEAKTTLWPPETILVDGLNILRSSDFKTDGFAALLRVLKANHHSPFSVFDASVFHVLRERGDDAGVALVKELVAHGEGKLVAAGSTADEVLLALGDKFKFPVVSLDNFSQYAEDFPWTQYRLHEGRRVHHPGVFRGELIIAALGICETIAG